MLPKETLVKSCDLYLGGLTIPRIVDKNDPALKECEVRLVDENNEQLGIVPMKDAQAMAEQRGFDLVLVAEQSTPLVCRMMNYGKFVYERNKRGRDHKKKQVKTGSKSKEIKFHANIDAHDYMIKVNHIRNFLKKGFKVKVSLFLRGREVRNKEIGVELMNKVGKEIEDLGTVESQPRLIGRNVGMYLAPISQK